MPDPILLLRPARSFYLSSVGQHFRPKITVIRADDPWFDKGGPLEGAREDFVPIKPTTGGAIYGGPEPIRAAKEIAAPAQRAPGRPKGSAAGGKSKETAAA